MRRIEDFTHVVLRLDHVTEDWNVERGPRKIVVRQDRIMPITYVERHYHDIVEIEATLMPVGSNMIHTAKSAMSQIMLRHESPDRVADVKAYRYLDLRHKIMEIPETAQEETHG